MRIYTKYHLGGKAYVQIIPVYVGSTIALLLSSFAMAGEGTQFISGFSIFASSQTTEDISSPSRYPRFSKQAKEDAAAFVASDGAIRGPFLESAILKVRITASPKLTDRDIAIFILGGS